MTNLQNDTTLQLEMASVLAFAPFFTTSPRRLYDLHIKIQINVKSSIK
jgi:hypothetical protein